MYSYLFLVNDIMSKHTYIFVRNVFCVCVYVCALNEININQMRKRKRTKTIAKQKFLICMSLQFIQFISSFHHKMFKMLNFYSIGLDNIQWICIDCFMHQIYTCNLNAFGVCVWVCVWNLVHHKYLERKSLCSMLFRWSVFLGLNENYVHKNERFCVCIQSSVHRFIQSEG